MDFWKVPSLGEEELGLPADDEKAQLARLKETEDAKPPRSPAAVQWPPVKPMAEEHPEKTGGRGARRKGKEAKEEGDKKGGDAKGEKGAGGQKREDGWLPKAEYEAKKREERARRQKEREQERGGDASAMQANPGGGRGGGAAAKGGAQKEDGKAQKGRGGRTGGRGNWEDIIPKRPEPVEETAEAKAAREAEEKRLECRDRLRGAATPSDLKAAIDAAREVGLTEEVRIGERKLARMEA